MDIPEGIDAVFVKNKEEANAVNWTRMLWISFVREKVSLVGHSYGRKTMTGLLVADRMRVGKRRVGRFLGRVASEQQALRARVARKMLNPVVYKPTTLVISCILTKMKSL